MKKERDVTGAYRLSHGAGGSHLSRFSGGSLTEECTLKFNITYLRLMSSSLYQTIKTTHLKLYNIK